MNRLHDFSGCWQGDRGTTPHMRGMRDQPAAALSRVWISLCASYFVKARQDLSSAHIP